MKILAVLIMIVCTVGGVWLWLKSMLSHFKLAKADSFKGYWFEVFITDLVCGSLLLVVMISFICYVWSI